MPCLSSAFVEPRNMIGQVSHGYLMRLLALSKTECWGPQKWKPRLWKRGRFRECESALSSEFDFQILNLWSPPAPNNRISSTNPIFGSYLKTHIIRHNAFCINFVFEYLWNFLLDFLGWSEWPERLSAHLGPFCTIQLWNLATILAQHTAPHTTSSSAHNDLGGADLMWETNLASEECGDLTQKPFQLGEMFQSQVILRSVDCCKFWRWSKNKRGWVD